MRVVWGKNEGPEDLGPFSCQVVIDLLCRAWLLNWEVNAGCASRERALGRAGGSLAKEP